MKKLNSKGFTLVELLAVIVILAVVMLLAVTAVGPLMAKSRKSALGTEGVALVTAAKTAYQAEQMGGNSKVKNNSNVCFDLEWLKTNGYFEKGKAEEYYGSVLVTYDDGTYSYKFWISNGTYKYEDVDPTSYDQSDAGEANSNASTTCGGESGVVKCTGTTCS